MDGFKHNQYNKHKVKKKNATEACLRAQLQAHEKRNVAFTHQRTPEVPFFLMNIEGKF